MSDYLRNSLDFTMYCSKHINQKLTFDSTLSKVGANSAMECNIIIVVHPCSLCKQENDKIKNAVTTLLNINK